MNHNDDIPRLSNLKLIDIDTDAEWSKFKANAGINDKPLLLRLSSSWKAAAAIAIIAGAGIIAYKTTTKVDTKTIASTNAPIETIVENSTEISLNQNSTIVYTDNRNKGKFEVALKGEAYFNVEKNPSRTFEITTDDITVTVKGTSFDVCESNDITTVTVTSGNVAVECHRCGKTIENLTRGKQAVYHKDGCVEVNNVVNFNDIAWKLKQFDFHDTPLSDIMEQLKKAYGNDYKFEDKTLANCTLTGSFNNQDLKTVLKIIEQALDIKINTETNGTIVIKK